MNEWMTEWVNEWINEWISEWMNECLRDRLAERMNERLSEAMAEAGLGGESCWKKWKWIVIMTVMCEWKGLVLGWHLPIAVANRHDSWCDWPNSGWCVDTTVGCEVWCEWEDCYLAHEVLVNEWKYELNFRSLGVGSLGCLSEWSHQCSLGPLLWLRRERLHRLDWRCKLEACVNQAFVKCTTPVCVCVEDFSFRACRCLVLSVEKPGWSCQ